MKVGIFDHTASALGGGQLVIGHMAELLSGHCDVELIHSGRGYGVETLATAFNLNLTRVKERKVEEFTDSFNIPGPRPLFQQIWNARMLSQPYDMFIYSGLGVPPMCFARQALAYCLFPMESSFVEELKSVPRWLQRNWVDRSLRAATYGLLWRIRMRKYKAILADSYFTARWVERRFGRRPEVLYPPVEIDLLARQKRNLIVSIGRFTASKRSKNQLEQVSAFREFVTRVSEDWQLCIIGSCTNSPDDHAYLDIVQEAARGLPVTLLVNVDRKTICQSLSEARLFWHTCGLAVDEEEYPQEAEHFGIATVEAMQAGCVPIVIASGGQREIIKNGLSGFLCRDLDEIIEKTAAVAQSKDLASAMGERALRESMAFKKDVFNQRFMSIVSRCLDR